MGFLTPGLIPWLWIDFGLPLEFVRGSAVRTLPVVIAPGHAQDSISDLSRLPPRLPDYQILTRKLSGRHIPKLRQVIGCVFQDFRLLQQKTVSENVAFALEVIGKSSDTIKSVVPEVLDMVGLSGKANRLPAELSGGEQQRVAIARAFVNRPLVLLADEPTGNLDPETSREIMDLLDRINRTGTTVLMATHDHHIVDSMRQRVVELSLGRLVRDEQRGVYGMDR